MNTFVTFEMYVAPPSASACDERYSCSHCASAFSHSTCDVHSERCASKHAPIEGAHREG